MNLKLALAGVLIAGTAIGFAMPDVIGDKFTAPADDLAAPQTPTLALAVTSEEPGWDESITLQRETDGHFYADVSVDGQPARMLVDTGASVVALTGDDAAAMGLSWEQSEVAVVAQGANGAVYGVQTVLPQVELGDFSAQDVPALIIPEGLQVSLLGQSFLSKIGVVEIAGDAMVMSSGR
jgi:aspartyl protease family protein